MANKISVILDVATEKAISGLKGFKQSVADADGAMGKIKAGGASAFTSIKQNAGLAAVGVVGAVGAMAAKSIEAASKLGESVNAVNVTFGQSASGIKALGEQAAESVGLSNSAFNMLAVQFSAFAKTVAGDGGDVVGTMDDLTTRVADFASVMNIDVAEAGAIFQSTLAGETEPIRKFGKDISAARVETFAYANGIAKVGEKLTEGQKVQARYALLMQETVDVADDFANTSTSLANSQKVLAAKMEDTAAKVGKDLAPALAKITTAMSDLIPVAGQVAVAVGGTFDKITDAAYNVGGALVTAFDKIPGVTMDLGPEVEHTLKELEDLEMGAEGLIAKYAKAGMTAHEFSLALKANGIEFTENNIATVAYARTLENTDAVTGDVVEVTDELTEAVDRTADGQAEAEAMIEQVNKTYGEQVEAVEAAAEALEELTQDMIDAVGSAFNLEQATLNLNSAYAGYQESILTTMGVLADSEATDREKEQALRDLRTQEIGVAGDALATAEAYAQEMGAADGSAASAQFQKEKLQQLAAAMPELRDEIQLYIDKLNLVPGVIRTRFEITATGATVTPHGDFIGLPGGARASGGPTYAGYMHPVTEQGSELLTEGGRTYLLAAANGHITPHNQLAAGWPAGAAASAGGANVSVVVEGNIYGDKHLRAQLDTWARNVQRELNGAA